MNQQTYKTIINLIKPLEGKHTPERILLDVSDKTNIPIQKIKELLESSNYTIKKPNQRKLI